MKLCNYCAEEIQDTAAVCTRCRIKMGALLMAGCLVLLWVVGHLGPGCSLWRYQCEPLPETVELSPQEVDIRARAGMRVPQTGESPDNSATKEVRSVQVRGSVIRVGDLFDDVVRVLKRSDSIAAPSVTRDANGSLIVVHTYKVGKDTIRLEARRFEDPGPYRVSRLWLRRDR